MFKKYAILFCILSVMLLGAGCGKNADTQEQDSIVNEDQGENIESETDYEKPETETYDLKPGEEAQGNGFNFFLTGIQEYKQIKTDKYTDKPEKGNVYLVLFLAFYNKTEEPVYIPADGLSAEVDGKEIENTFLVNDPEDYSPIFQEVGAGDNIAGYLVWEVPSDWKKFTITYRGLEEACQDIITATITPDMVFEPEEMRFEKQ